jgi:hypothetical protein
MRITWLALSDRGNAVQPEFATLGGPQGNEASTRSGEPSNPGRPEATQTPGPATEASASNIEGPNADPASANAGSSTPDSTAAKAAFSGAAGSAANPSGKSARSTTGTVPRTETRTFRKEGPQGALRITYDDLDLKLIAGIETITETTQDELPAWLKQLHGKRVRLRGYMFPGTQSEGITRFQFCRDTGVCCFGPNPVPFYFTDVTLREGHSTDFINLRPFDVEGDFGIDFVLSDGYVLQVWTLKDAVIVKK